MKKALIIGAGPAGLTAAYELLTKSKDIEVVVFEESDCFGGISKTVNYKGNRMEFPKLMHGGIICVLCRVLPLMTIFF